MMTDGPESGGEPERQGAGARPVSGLLGALGSLGVVGIALLINADVFSRALFNRPIPSVADLISVSIVAVVFLQLPDCVAVDRMIGSDLLKERLFGRRPRAQRVLDIVSMALGAAVMAAIVWFVIPEFADAWGEDRKVGIYGVFQFVYWPVPLCVVIGAAMACVQYLVLLIRVMRGERLPGDGGGH